MWYSMLARAYSENYHKSKPTYIKCTVCKEWHNFQVFGDWYEENYYEINGEKTQLDKDILFKNNKTYSPENCIFVPESINILFTNNLSNRGSLPLGKYILWLKNYKMIATEVYTRSDTHFGIEHFGKWKGGITDLLGLKIKLTEWSPNTHREINRVYAVIIEAKASLSDFKNGYNTGAELSYIISPKGIIPHELIPGKIGLIEVDMDNYSIKVKRGEITLSGVEEVIKAKRRLPKLFGDGAVHKSESYLRWGIKTIESIAYRNTVSDIFNKNEIKIIKNK